MSIRRRVERALALVEERVELGAFWALDRDRALAEAERLDADRGRPTGALAGVPVAIKDLFDQAGLPTTGGLPGGVAPASSDAAVVHRLRAAGAIPIGKTAMDPLGCTTGGQAPGFPPCINPLDPKLSPGGSSSGSAVAVAAGIVDVALGTDTAGSARIPAAYCGISAFKPVRRALPRRGCVAVMPSFETPSLLGASLGDCVRAYTALRGNRHGAGKRASRPRGPLRVGVLADLLEEAEPFVSEACRGGLARLGPRAAVLEEVTLAWRPEGMGAAFAYELAENWGAEADREPQRFTEIIRGTIEFGRGIGLDEYREVLSSFAAARRGLRRRLRSFDAVACPTVPIPAPRREAESVRISTSFTRLFNALDWPALSVPVALVPGAAPVALQIAGFPSRIEAVIELGLRIERAARRGDR